MAPKSDKENKDSKKSGPASSKPTAKPSSKKVKEDDDDEEDDDEEDHGHRGSRSKAVILEGFVVNLKQWCERGVKRTTGRIGHEKDLVEHLEAADGAEGYNQEDGRTQQG